MPCGNGWGRNKRCYDWGMDALQERMRSESILLWLGHGCFAGMDGVGVRLTSDPLVSSSAATKIDRNCS